MNRTASLELGSDLRLRYRYFTPESMAHPAKAHLGLVQHLIDRYTMPGQTILDPMAGIGSTALALLSQRNVILREIEPHFLAEAHRNVAHILDAAGLFAGRATVGYGDAMQPWPDQADVVLCSPPYGCDMSTNAWRSKGVLSHKARLLAERPGKLGDRWRRLTDQQGGAVASLRFHYGDHPAQIGHWRGARYWQAMETIYGHARAALPPGGVMILILKDHIRRRQRVCVADDTVTCCERLGFRLGDRVQRRVYPLSLWQRRRKETGEPIVEEEDALIFQVPP